MNVKKQWYQKYNPSIQNFPIQNICEELAVYMQQRHMQKIYTLKCEKSSEKDRSIEPFMIVISLILLFVVDAIGFVCGINLWTCELKSAGVAQTVTFPMLAIFIGMVLLIALETYSVFKFAHKKFGNTKISFTRIYHKKRIKKMMDFEEYLSKYHGNQILKDLRVNIAHLRKMISENPNILAVNNNFDQMAADFITVYETSNEYLNEKFNMNDKVMVRVMNDTLKTAVCFDRCVIKAIEEFNKYQKIGLYLSDLEENIRKQFCGMDDRDFTDLLNVDAILDPYDSIRKHTKEIIMRDLEKCKDNMSYMGFDFIRKLVKRLEDITLKEKDCIFSWLFISRVENYIRYMDVLYYCHDKNVKTHHMQQAKMLYNLFIDDADAAIAMSKTTELQDDIHLSIIKKTQLESCYY